MTARYEEGRFECDCGELEAVHRGPTKLCPAGIWLIRRRCPTCSSAGHVIATVHTEAQMYRWMGRLHSGGHRMCPGPARDLAER